MVDYISSAPSWSSVLSKQNKQASHPILSGKKISFLKIRSSNYHKICALLHVMFIMHEIVPYFSFYEFCDKGLLLTRRSEKTKSNFKKHVFLKIVLFLFLGFILSILTIFFFYNLFISAFWTKLWVSFYSGHFSMHLILYTLIRPLHFIYPIYAVCYILKPRQNI